MYDFIGDIHGHAGKLEQLLQKLGYQKKGESYQHSKGRKIFFLGDYIDRGPKIRETLQIVKSMVDSENALAIMGNHEYNALCYFFEDKKGGHLRKHYIKNTVQHYEMLRQFDGKQKEYEMYIDWFMTLPLYFENDDFRAMHATWDSDTIEHLRSTLTNDRLNEITLRTSASPKRKLFRWVEDALKGKEIPLPDGHSFKDKGGHIRTNIRVKWWNDPKGSPYKEISVLPIPTLPDLPVPKTLQFANPYPKNEKPVFFGHYWLNGTPTLLTPNVCCLDFSVAKDGYLAAYRFDGEQTLSEEKLVWV